MRDFDRRTVWVVLLGVLSLGAAADLHATDAWALRDSDAPPSDVLELEAIFSNNFESGDSSGWSDTTANSCPAPTGGPTLHANSVLANEIWTASGSPHIVTTNVTVPAGVTLTVAPCAEVRIHAGSNITVLGTLVARGTPLQRITIHRDDPALPFAYLWVRSPGFADIAFADIVGGGSSGTALLIEGVDSPATQPAALDHVKVTGSAGYGLQLFRNAGLAATSRDLVISGSGATAVSSPYPVRMGLANVGTLPTGTYTGNASDAIQVIISATLQSDLTFHSRGVPYQLGGGGSSSVLLVDGTSTIATLTLDAGAELHFYSQGSNIGGLFVGALGRLVAVGTPTTPVVLTGVGIGAAPPAPGSWEGVTFFQAVNPGTLLDHVRIDAAGAHGGDQGFGCPPLPDGSATDGALKIFVQPPTQFLVHSTISNSISHGVFRAWTGGLVDFLPTNSFENVAFCQQVLPHPPLPSICPVDPDCPQ